MTDVTDSHKGTLLAFAPGSWGWPEFCGSPRYHLWTLAGMGWRVLYVEPPTKLRLMRSMWKAPDREFHVLSPARVVPFGVRGIKSEANGEKWRRSTGEQLAARGLAAMKDLGWKKADFVWFGAPWHSPILEAMPKDVRTINHVYDELSLSPALSSMQREVLWMWERELVRACDLTLCSSLPQKDRRNEVAQRAFLLENAVREDFIFTGTDYVMNEQTRHIAARLDRIAPPRFLYGGVADHRVNPEFFRAILENLPSGNVVFLGKQDKSLDADFAREAQVNPRIHFLGDIPYSCMAPLLRMGDVLLIGHKRMPFTDAMYPEKLNEYLATGRPIVSVALTEVGRVARESTHEGLIRTADTPWEFVAAVTSALAERNPVLEEARIMLAKNHTWGMMGQRLERELLAEMHATRGPVTPASAAASHSGIHRLDY
jgi:glycosyltransferase involved in cell wall biosynthesis